MTQREKATAELVQAKADWIANVPGAWERYQYWQDELVRLIVTDDEERAKE